jgi:hypothetical protein
MKIGGTIYPTEKHCHPKVKKGKPPNYLIYVKHTPNDIDFLHKQYVEGK